MSSYIKWLLFALCMGACAFAYHSWYSRVRHLRWKGERVAELLAISRSLQQYSKANGDSLPPSLTLLATEGCIPPLILYDSNQGVTIIRDYRPVPSTKLPRDLIILAEEYDPPLDESAVMKLDGEVVMTRELGKRLAQDDTLRRKLAIPLRWAYSTSRDTHKRTAIAN